MPEKTTDNLPKSTDQSEKKKLQTRKKTSEKESVNDSNDNSQNGIVDDDIFEGLPKEVKNSMGALISMSRVTGMREHPLALKINEAHIDKILDLSEKDDERHYKDARNARLYKLFYFLISVALLIFLTLYLAPSHSALYKDIINILVLFAGGLGAGYGIKTYKEKKGS